MSKDLFASSQNDIEAVLIDTVVESWRFAGVFERAIETANLSAAHRHIAKVAYFRDRLREYLADAGLHIVEPDADAAFDPGMAVTALNLDEFEEDDTLVIDQVLEPTVMGRDGIRRMGTVLLRKVE